MKARRNALGERHLCDRAFFDVPRVEHPALRSQRFVVGEQAQDVAVVLGLGVGASREGRFAAVPALGIVVAVSRAAFVVVLDQGLEIDGVGFGGQGMIFNPDLDVNL